MSHFTDALLRHFRDPLHSIVDKAYDTVQAEALQAIDGEPDEHGQLTALERELTEPEREIAKNLVLTLRARVHNELDRVLDLVD